MRTNTARLGSFRRIPVTADIERSMDKTTLTLGLDGVVQLSAADLHAADPTGLITRIENRISRLETRKQDTIDGIQQARREIAHARQSLGQPFPQAAQLTEARDHAQRNDEQLDQIAAGNRHENAEPDQRPTWDITEAIAAADAVARDTITASSDWRDQVIRSGNDWMPSPVRPHEAGAQPSFEHDSPEVGQ